MGRNAAYRRCTASRVQQKAPGSDACASAWWTPGPLTIANRFSGYLVGWPRYSSFQSSTNPKVRCYLGRWLDSPITLTVSILNRPEGPLLRRLRRDRGRAGLVSILNRPEGPLLHQPLVWEIALMDVSILNRPEGPLLLPLYHKTKHRGVGTSVFCVGRASVKSKQIYHKTKRRAMKPAALPVVLGYSALISRNSQSISQRTPRESTKRCRAAKRGGATSSRRSIGVARLSTLRI